MTNLLLVSILLSLSRVQSYNSEKYSTEGAALMDSVDSADKIMDRNDLKIFNKLNDEEKDSTGIKLAMDRESKLEAQRAAVAKILDTDAVYALTSKDFWDKLYKFLMENFGEFWDGTFFSIALQIRYNFCLYVVLCLPPQIGFIIPSFYRSFIPRKAFKVPIVKEALVEMDRFLAFVKKKSKNELLVTFHFGIDINPKEDLKFLLRIPDLIKTDPVQILRWLLRFKIKADGFS